MRNLRNDRVFYDQFDRIVNSTLIPAYDNNVRRGADNQRSFEQIDRHADSKLFIFGERRFLSNRSGYSLIELIVTVAIVAILAAAATLSTSFVKREKIISVSKEIITDFQVARSDAMRQGSPSNTIHGVGIRFTQTSYTRFTYDDAATPNYQYDGAAEEVNAETKNLTSAQAQILVGGTLLSPAPPNNVVIFDSFGFPRQSNWQRITDAAPMVVVISDSSAGYSRCIRIGTNRIREGTWNGVACNEQ